MASKTPVIALLYDFDKTLCTKDMQEYSFIPNIGMQPQDFWEQANHLATELKMDRILAYMYLMIKKADANGQSIRREDFVSLGKDIAFFRGVPQWFDRIAAFGSAHGVKIEHYIISSGLREIIEGSQISSHFREIFACAFHYNASGAADWPLTAVNYTGKTQFLFRINKGVLDLSDDDSLNKSVPDELRPVPFRNMIYIGDGLTDVPCMKLVKVNGGQSIAVYQRSTRQKVENLLTDGRVDFVAPADYSENSRLDRLVKSIVTKMAAVNELAAEHFRQMHAARSGGGERE